MVVTPRNFYVAVERGSGERERENGKRLESERSLCFCHLRGKTPR